MGPVNFRETKISKQKNCDVGNYVMRRVKRIVQVTAQKPLEWGAPYIKLTRKASRIRSWCVQKWTLVMRLHLNLNIKSYSMQWSRPPHCSVQDGHIYEHSVAPLGVKFSPSRTASFSDLSVKIHISGSCIRGTSEVLSIANNTEYITYKLNMLVFDMCSCPRDLSAAMPQKKFHYQIIPLRQ